MTRFCRSILSPKENCTNCQRWWKCCIDIEAFSNGLAEPHSGPTNTALVGSDVNLFRSKTSPVTSRSRFTWGKEPLKKQIMSDLSHNGTSLQMVGTWPSFGDAGSSIKCSELFWKIGCLRIRNAMTLQPLAYRFCYIVFSKLSDIQLFEIGCLMLSHMTLKVILVACFHNCVLNWLLPEFMFLVLGFKAVWSNLAY